VRRQGVTEPFPVSSLGLPFWSRPGSAAAGRPGQDDPRLLPQLARQRAAQPATPAGAHIHGQVILGVIVCGIAAYLSVRFLVRWFQTRTLAPFSIYCLAFGALSILRFL
jgi:undecaprenyl pyrophosphate phosphatase UppP